jgi:alpha-tubulin suppressor-like RCC1 family protein
VAVKSDGTLWTWGRNEWGQLGDGTMVNQSSPVQVGSTTNWRSVAAGHEHTVAVKSDGTLWTWGRNEWGQLGDGTMVNQSIPVQVGSATNWQSVAAGHEHTVAVKSDGTLWTWGGNSYGQLGDGRTTPGKIGLPTILTHPQGQLAPVGTRVSFFLTVTGSKPLSCRWQCNGANLADGAQVSGSQGASLTLISLQSSDAGDYRVIVTNSYGSVTSAVAVLTVRAALPPSFQGIQSLPGNAFALQLAGETNHLFQIQASSNLTTWFWLATLTNQTGMMIYTNLDTGNAPIRFYKAIQLP